MTSTEFVYCPKKLHVAINGEAYDDRLTREVLDNLLHQNILLRCYAQGQTAQELCDELGVGGAPVHRGCGERAAARRAADG